MNYAKFPTYCKVLIRSILKAVINSIGINYVLKIGVSLVDIISNFKIYSIILN